MGNGHTDTAALLMRWHGGDRAALADLVEQNLPWIRAQVERRLGPLLRSVQDPQDYVHDAVVEVLSDGPRFLLADGTQLRWLLARMVENLLRDRVEFHQAHKRDVRRQEALQSQSALALDPSLASATRPSEAAARNEMQAWIQLGLQMLAPVDRRVVLLRLYEDLPFAEVGEALGLNANAARMRFERALQKLADRIRELQAGRLARVLEQGEQESLDP